MFDLHDHLQHYGPKDAGAAPTSAKGGTPVLVVDDDAEIRKLISEVLRRDGEFRPFEAADSATALELARVHADALMVLDISLPDRSGLDVLRELRRDSERPVILLTGRKDEADRVVGLELGADDYVTKPCYPREVLARVRAVLRRTSPTPTAATAGRLQLGDVVIDTASRFVHVGEREIDLTAREFDLLAHLAQGEGRAFSRAELLAAVWESQPEWQRDSTVTEHVFRLRTKLGVSEGEAGWIQTVRGVGYRITP